MVENEITCSMKLHKNDLTHTTGNRSVFPIDPYSVSLQIGVEAVQWERRASIMQVDAGQPPIQDETKMKQNHEQIYSKDSNSG